MLAHNTSHVCFTPCGLSSRISLTAATAVAFLGYHSIPSLLPLESHLAWEVSLASGYISRLLQSLSLLLHHHSSTNPELLAIDLVLCGHFPLRH
jgi:hypothetical protein